MRVRAVHWIAGASLAACVAVVLVLLLMQSEEPSVKATKTTIAANISTDRVLTESAEPSQFVAIDDVAISEENTIDLLAACPDPAAESLS